MSIEKFEEYAKHNIENFCDAMFDGHCYVMRENSRLTKEKKQFLILSCNQSLRLWRYLNREGYKLVLVEPTDVKLKEFQKIWFDSGCAHIMKKKTALDLYKTMIGEETK